MYGLKVSPPKYLLVILAVLTYAYNSFDTFFEEVEINSFTLKCRLDLVTCLKNCERKTSNLTAEKPCRHDFNWITKLTSLLISHVDFMRPLII